PLTALAMEVRYGKEPAFEAAYHTSGTLWKGVVFPLERAYVGRTKAQPVVLDDGKALTVETDDEESPEISAENGESESDEATSRLDSVKKQALLLVKND